MRNCPMQTRIHSNNRDLNVKRGKINTSVLNALSVSISAEVGWGVIYSYKKIPTYIIYKHTIFSLLHRQYLCPKSACSSSGHPKQSKNKSKKMCPDELTSKTKGMPI